MADDMTDTLAKIALIRWYANALENIALERYMGDRTNIGGIQAALKRAFAAMFELPGRNPKDPNQCKWNPCPDGSCSPDCINFRLPSGFDPKRIPELFPGVPGLGDR